MRFTLLLALNIGIASSAFAQGGAVPQSDSAFVREYPLALVYRGVARFEDADYQAAAEDWQMYLRLAGKDADSASVNVLIHEAYTRQFPGLLVYEALSQAAGGDPDGAVRSLERYQELAGDDADTINTQAMAETVFFLAYPMARLYQGVAFYLAGDYRQAIGAWEQYIVFVTGKERADVSILIARAREEWESETVAMRF